MARTREKDGGGGRGSIFLCRTYFGGYFFKNSNLEGGTLFVELLYNLNTNPP